jgi:hypothetical protein
MSAKFQPPAEANSAPSRPMHWSTDPACWRNYAADLIHGAASNPAAYAREVARRNRNVSAEVALRNGRGLRDELLRMFPKVQGEGALAKAATGEDLADPVARAERWAATVARCEAWLPKQPDTGMQLARAERDRRAGITDAERMEQAMQTAEKL